MIDRSNVKAVQTRYQDMLFKSVVPFWLNHAQDTQYGGISTCLDRAGNIYSPDKSVWMQGRTAWTFSRLCNQYGVQDEWLNMAKSCIDFLDQHCIDPADGRMYFTVTQDGRPLRKRRYFFSEAFYTIGHAEYALAAGDQQALEQARYYYTFICRLYDDPSSDPFKIWPKTLPETRRMRSFSSCMIMLDVTSVMRRCDPENSELYDRWSKRFADDIIRYHYKPEFHCVLETVGEAGEFLSELPEGRVINAGHAIECSWFMADEASYRNDPVLMQQALDIYNGAMKWGWDEVYGGIKYFVDVLGHPPVQYEHDMKLWWPVSEALIASLKHYLETGEQRYWNDFERLTDYMETYLADPDYGEWFGYLRRDNKPTDSPAEGGIYNGPFHVPRALMAIDHLLQTIAQKL